MIIKSSLNRLCFVGVFILVLVATSNVNGGRSNSRLFVCENGRSIPMSWHCDDENDCGDESDEQGCAPRTCSDKEFRCDNGKCIPQRWQCDEEDDCHDHSDENKEKCSNKTCTPDQFSCSGGMCIPQSWQCDEQEDCPNGEDEQSCAEVSCSTEELKCNNSKCITRTFHCDGEDDCGDNSDETNCPEPTCSPDELSCGEGKRCIPKSWVCDGTVDCTPDGIDEKDCDTGNTNSPCSSMEFACHTGDCIHKSWVCDGDSDCTDDSDELDCGETSCRSDQFQCVTSKNCIIGYKQCDGKKDCPDDSDEANCPTSKSSCNEQEFDCAEDGSQCIKLGEVCDKNPQCTKSEDEDWTSDGFCNNDPCKVNNGGCMHKCHIHPHMEAGFFCSCNTGFKLASWDDKTCDDINECDVVGTCSQICINTKGSYKCECHPGYMIDHANPGYMIDHANETFCKAAGKEPVLLFANRMDVRQISLHTHQYKAVVEGARSAVALDYDYSEETVYWSDVALETINSTKLGANGTLGSSRLVISDVKTPDGLAFDWIHKHLYWTDTGHNSIEVMHVKSRHHRTLINENLDEPRAIVLDPREKHGWMYWTDWGETPVIAKAGLDGSARSVIVQRDIQWPNGLTIDYVSNRLFWVDAKLHLIGSSDLQGNTRKVILRSESHLKHPFAITVFEDWLYWTDWETESIHKVNKFTGNNLQNVAISLYSPMDVHVYHALKQPLGVNFCGQNNGLCTHMCLPSPHKTDSSAKYACACPNGMILKSDQLSCEDIPPTTDDGQTVQSSPSPTIVKENAVPPHLRATTKYEDHDIGKIAGIVVACLVVLVIVGVIITFFVYRSYSKRNVQSMNFDNPVYRKTTEDQFCIEKNEYSSSRPSTMEPLTASNSELV